MPSKKEKKVAMADKIFDLLGKHKQIIIASLSNVSSSQIQDVRLLLRKSKGELVVGKNVAAIRAMLTLLDRHCQNNPRENRW
jgi:ribosomal protein L10